MSINVTMMSIFKITLSFIFVFHHPHGFTTTVSKASELPHTLSNTLKIHPKHHVILYITDLKSSI